MPFEIYSRTTGRVGTPMITFTTLGRIALNKSASRFLEKDAVEFVILLWDKETKQVGIRPLTKRDHRAYRVAYGKKGNGAGFSAKTFMDFINYDYTVSRSYPVEWNDKEGMLQAQIPAEHFRDTRQQKLANIEPTTRFPLRGVGN